MKTTIKNMLYIAAMATAITACSGEDSPLIPEANTPITVSATIPGDVWAVATRTGIGDSYTDGSMTVTGIFISEWTLHYTDYNGNPASGTLKATSQSNGTYTLTAGSDLVWERIKDTKDADETFYLTCKDSYGVTYYATTTAAHGAETVAFTTAVAPTMAKFTVKFELTHNMAEITDNFTVTIDAKAAADSYSPKDNAGVWPAKDEAVTNFPVTHLASSNGTVSGSMFLPQQTMGNTLTVKYGTTATWTLDLSQVSVAGGKDEQKANQLIVGQHLTLNLTASLTSLNTPSGIEIEAFTAADEDSYENELDGSAKKSNP